MTDRLRKAVGGGLRQAREDKRYSQAAVAKALGVTQATVSRWETGEATPDAIDLAQLSVVYDVDPAGLLPAATEVKKASAADLRRRVKALESTVNRKHFRGGA